jgi:alpha-D-ribose 1-methylphosphonate 5-triphosphate synthase subunit PhnG
VIMENQIVPPAQGGSPDGGMKDAADRRRDWVKILAKANPAALQRLADTLGEWPGYSILRGPEAGLVMVRGRAGGTGAAFNLGEMTVTRCSVRLDDGTVGHAYVKGREAAHCQTAALLDALLQQPDRHEALWTNVIAPLAHDAAERRQLAARKTAATKVDFFTMSTGQPQS